MVGANALAKEALESEPADDLRGEALLIHAQASVLAGDKDAAAQRLAQAKPLLPPDSELLTDAANVALALMDAKSAAELAGRAVEVDPDSADAAYAFGLASDALGDTPTARAMFVRTSELDGGEPDPPWAMSVEEFAALVEDTLQELPDDIVKRLENVPIIVEAAPALVLIEDGVDPRLLGLFSGVPLSETSSIEPGQPSLDAIHLFQRNLERSCVDREELEAEIRITVLHETAHFFGLEDDDLEDLGLG